MGSMLPEERIIRWRWVGERGREAFFPDRPNVAIALSSLNLVPRMHENLFQGGRSRRRLSVPDDRSRHNCLLLSPGADPSFFPVGKSGEDNTLCQSQHLHRFSCEIVQPVLIAIPDKNILSRMALMSIPIEKAISLPACSRPRFFHPHLLWSKPSGGRKYSFGIGPGENSFSSLLCPLRNGFLAVLIGDLSIAHYPLEILPVGIGLDRLGKGRGEESQVEQDRKKMRAGTKPALKNGRSFSS